jgi:hypothetical protein
LANTLAGIAANNIDMWSHHVIWDFLPHGVWTPLVNILAEELGVLPLIT